MADDLRSGVSRREFIVAAGSAGAVGLAGCTENNPGGGSDGGDGKLSGTVEMAGSSTVFPLAEAVANEFRKEHSNVNINVRSTGSGGGFSNWFCKGRTHFNNASRPIQKSEKQKCSSNNVDWVELTVATDALTVVVNNKADWVDCVTVDELKQIWGPGGASKWSDVRDDWPDQPFELYGPTSASGTFDYFTEAVTGEEGNHRSDYTATENDSQIVQGVQGSKYAMGYFGFAYYSKNKDAVTALGIDDGDGKCVKPSLQTAKSGKYKPFSRPLYTYASKNALSKKHVAEFARFFVEQSGNEKIVADSVGYVPNTDKKVQEELDQLNAAIKEAQG